jgi:hypothetical protein
MLLIAGVHSSVLFVGESTACKRVEDSHAADS